MVFERMDITLEHWWTELENDATRPEEQKTDIVKVGGNSWDKKEKVSFQTSLAACNGLPWWW